MIQGCKLILLKKKKIVSVSTYTHSMEVKISVFSFETLPTFSVNISLNISDRGKPFRLLEENITCLNRLIFL